MPFLPGNIEHYSFRIEGLDAPLRLLSLNGTEFISRPYLFNFELVSETPDLDFNSIVGKPAFITLHTPDGESERYINGIVNKFSQSKQGRRFTTYHVELVPSLWLLSYRTDIRIFQNKTVKYIIESVLLDAGISIEQYNFVLQGQYTNREYCVQYRESDLAFISRLLEEEGMFYFFEHTKTNHMLTIADNACVHKSISRPNEVPFHAPTGLNDSNEFISEFKYSQEIRPGKVLLNDYNYDKPQLNLLSEESSNNDAELTLYDYPSEYQTAERGTQLAKMRLQENQAVRQTIQGNSNCKRMLPGYRFTLQDYVRDDFNKEYLLTSVSHNVAQPQVMEEEANNAPSEYDNKFECIPVDVPYRPQRITKKPRVEGIQTAVVVGPAGEEIYTDEHGRIKVQFHWDREGEHDEHSSCWIRVSQISAGCGWGTMYIPRVGHEVIVDFIEGDPDRPIVTGSVYHATNTPHYSLPEHKTKSSISSSSTPGGDGFNALVFEDKVGEEELFLHAQNKMRIKVKGSKEEWVAGLSSELVTMSKIVNVAIGYSISVGGIMNINVMGDKIELVLGNDTLNVRGDRKVDVTGNLKHIVLKDYDVATKNNYKVNADKILLEANSKIEFKVGKSSLIIDENSISIDSDKINIKGKSVDISGSSLVDIKGALININ